MLFLPYIFLFVIQVVAPKKEKLAAAEAELAIQMKQLNLKRAELKEVSAWVPAVPKHLVAIVQTESLKIT